jgi:hypothetical protein
MIEIGQAVMDAELIDDDVRAGWKRIAERRPH